MKNISNLKTKEQVTKSGNLTSSKNTRNLILGCSDSADGSTEATSMQKVDVTKRSANNLILTILQRSSKDLVITDDQRSICCSLLWPFVARRSLRKNEWFSTPDLERVVSSFKKTIERIIKFTDSKNSEQVFVKYWLDYFMCQVFGDSQRPERQDWIDQPLFSGWLRRFVARSIAKKDVSFIYSLQKGSKRLWPQLGNFKMNQALEKHRERLTEPHGLVPDDLSYMIQRTSLEVFRNTNNGDLPALKFIPSGSSCLQATVKDGGALSLFNPLDVESILTSDLSSKLGKLRALEIELELWRKREFDFCRKIVEKDIEEGASNLFDLQVVAVPEPCKFRIITKGNGYLYSLLQPVQAMMLDDWKVNRHSTMLCNERLVDRVREIDENCRFCEYWCSVDYEAATDLIKKEATLDCLRPLTGMPMSNLVFNCIAGSGTIKYPKVEGFPTLPDGELYDGQLMGHPLSFPILCTINLAVYRTALGRWVQAAQTRNERRSRKFKSKILWENVLVNGDDMLFKCEKSFYDIFCHCARDAGLKPSIGKNYLSEDMCMINSQIFRREGKRMEKCGYLNLKFLVPNEKCSPTQLTKDVNKMCSELAWGKCIIPSIFNRFKTDRFKPNWYLPVHLGGYGLELKYSPSSWNVSRQQRMVARMFLKNEKLMLFRSEQAKERNNLRGNKKLMDLIGKCQNFSFRQPFCPLNSHETEENPWMERLSLIKRLTEAGGLITSVEGPVLSKEISHRFQEFKPVKFSTLASCWEMAYKFWRGPIVPDLHYLKI